MVLNFIAENARKALVWALGTLAVLSIAGYTYYEFHPFLLGPIITVETPQSGSTVVTPLVEVRGTAKNITEITFNGRPITINEEGEFIEETAMPEGYAILTLAAKDRFGRTTTHTIELWRQPKPQIPKITSSSTPAHATSTQN